MFHYRRGDPLMRSLDRARIEAGTTWEKGKRFEITWTSSGIRGAVKIDLVDPKGKATPLARQTLNNGKYSFTLMQSIAEGDYKIRISSMDGKTVGSGTPT